MEFTLVYEGSLKANGSVNAKQELRRAFHQQLFELRSLPPFTQERNPDFLTYGEADEPQKFQKLSGFTFVPLVSTYLKAIAELDIIMLRPEPPGSIVTQSGDIDNRLKTLLDSLRIPQSKQEIPPSDSPVENENPFFCLLEDDNLVTKLTVSTDRLLKPNCNPSLVSLIIHVKTKVLMVTCDNIDLA
jgi:hypothetical protein